MAIKWKVFHPDGDNMVLDAEFDDMVEAMKYRSGFMGSFILGDNGSLDLDNIDEKMIKDHGIQSIAVPPEGKGH